MITITPTDIESTEYFQGLSPILRKLSLQKKSRQAIQNGVNVAANIGLEKWEQITGERYTHRMIIKELLETRKEKV